MLELRPGGKGLIKVQRVVIAGDLGILFYMLGGQGQAAGGFLSNNESHGCAPTLGQDNILSYISPVSAKDCSFLGGLLPRKNHSGRTREISQIRNVRSVAATAK